MQLIITSMCQPPLRITFKDRSSVKRTSQMRSSKAQQQSDVNVLANRTLGPFTLHFSSISCHFECRDVLPGIVYPASAAAPCK